LSLGFDKRLSCIDAALEEAHGNGILVFAATSNNGAATSRHIAWPASMIKVFGINSAEFHGRTSSFNPPEDTDDGFSRYKFLGEGVRSAWPLHLDEGEEKTLTGTSMATPIAAATAALFIEFIRQNAWDEEVALDAEIIETPVGMKAIFQLIGIAMSGGEYLKYITPWCLLRTTDEQPIEACRKLVLDRIHQALSHLRVYKIEEHDTTTGPTRGEKGLLCASKDATKVLPEHQHTAASKLGTGVHQHQGDSSHLDNYIIDCNPTAITDSTGISAEHSIVLAIQDWSKATNSQMLWVIGAMEKTYPSSTSRIAASVVYSPSQLAIPIISYFCDWSSQETQDQDPIISILYSLIRQLLNIKAWRFNASIDLSDRRLQLLNGTEHSLDEALRLLKELLYSVPPLIWFVIDGIDHFDSLQRNRQPIEALLLILKECVSVGAAGGDGGRGIFKLLFTTAGNCAILNNVGREVLREVKSCERGQIRRPGRPRPGRSNLVLMDLEGN
jgi:hypothetical protein